jgi:hypothetical protein
MSKWSINLKRKKGRESFQSGSVVVGVVVVDDSFEERASGMRNPVRIQISQILSSSVHFQQVILVIEVRSPEQDLGQF